MIKKKKQSKPMAMVFGLHPVLELLKAKKRPVLAIYTTITEPKGFGEIKNLLSARVELHHVKKALLDQRAGTTDHQSIIAMTRPLPTRKKFFNPEKEPFLLMLDSIQDARNLGAILRSAYCTGVNGVILTQKNSAPLTAAAFKSSAGLAEHLQIYETPTAASALLELKKAGYAIYATVFNGKQANTVDYKKPLCIVIGNEAKGVSPETKKQGIAITLPQVAGNISYNASVAAGITLFTVATKLDII